jgi:hypothetical protein
VGGGGDIRGVTPLMYVCMASFDIFEIENDIGWSLE